MEVFTGCLISRSHIDTTESEEPDELPPPPPACGLKGSIRPYDLSCVACYAVEDGVGTYEDFVNARVSPYVKGDAPIELGVETNGPEQGRNSGMIDAEVVQACRKGDVAELERLGLTMDLEAVDVLGYSAVRACVCLCVCVFACACARAHAPASKRSGARV